MKKLRPTVFTLRIEQTYWQPRWDSCYGTYLGPGSGQEIGIVKQKLFEFTIQKRVSRKALYRGFMTTVSCPEKISHVHGQNSL